MHNLIWRLKITYKLWCNRINLKKMFDIAATIMVTSCGLIAILDVKEYCRKMWLMQLQLWLQHNYGILQTDIVTLIVVVYSFLKSCLRFNLFLRQEKLLMSSPLGFLLQLCVLSFRESVMLTLQIFLQFWDSVSMLILPAVWPMCLFCFTNQNPCYI